MPSRPAIWKDLAYGIAALIVSAIVATGGCSNSSTPAPTPSPSPIPTPSSSPTLSPSPIPSPVNFVVMNYASVPPTMDPTYGAIQGYGQTTTVPAASPVPTVSSQVVTVHCNQTIGFYNLDRSAAHTASLLGPAAGMNWPANFNNINGATTASPVLTPITTPEFSTGNIFQFSTVPGTSLVYTTGGSAGSFYFGDFYDYKPVIPGFPQMRTVITILCP